MNTEFCKVELDLSKGSAYEYRKDSEIPTTIKFGRYHNGKFEKGKVIGNFTNLQMHDIIYLIKRGYSREDITKQCNTVYPKD